tara:strand:+ start:141 stop:4238 length:4098 start_codon:yes stop_codon:yes gene_type:complete
MSSLPSYLNIPSGPTPTPRDIREATKREPIAPVTAGEMFNEATLYGRLIEYFDTPTAPDPSFKITEELLNRQTQGIPPELIPSLAESTSELEFMYRVRSVRERLDRQQRISNLGVSGMAAQFGMALLDPVFLVAAPVAGLALGGKGVQAAVATRTALRGRAALRGGAASLAVDVPLEGLRFAIDPFTDAEDFVINTSASLVMGSALSYAFPRLAGFDKNWKIQVELERRRIDSDILSQNEDILEEAAQAALDPQQAAAVRARAEQLGVPIYEDIPDTRAQRVADSLEDLGGDTTVEVDGQTAQVQGPRQFRPLSEVIEDLEKAEPQGPRKSFDTDFEEVTSLPKKDLFAEAKRRGVATQTTVEVAEEVAPEAVPAPPRTVQSHEAVGGDNGKRLAGAKPRYRQASETTFGDDVDKSILAGGTSAGPNASQRRHREYVMAQLGISESQFFELRTQFMEAHKGMYKKDSPIRMSRENIKGGAPEAAPAPSPKPRTRQRRQFRPIDDIRADVVEARRNETQITGQALTAMRTALLGLGDETRSALNLVEETAEEIAEDLAKPYAPESLSSRVLNFVPGFKPLAVMAQRSTNENVRNLFRALVENPAGGVTRDAETRVIMNRSLAMNKYHKIRVAIRKTSGHQALNKFDEDIARSIREGTNLEGQAGQAQTIIRQFFKELIAYGERSGLDSFSDIINPRYIPREASARKVLDLIDKHGEEKILELLERSLKNNEPDFSTKKIKATARAWLKYAHDPESYVNARVTGKNAPEKINAIKEVLQREGLSAKDIDDVLDRIIPKSSDPHLGMTNNRINFDESFSMELNGDTVRFSDLLENDLTYLMEKYAARVIGASELAKVSKALNIKFDGSIPTKAEMEAWLKETGELSSDIAAGFDVTYRAIMGMSQGNLDPRARHALRFLQDLAFVQSMGNVGIAQLPELANSTVSNGLRATLQSVPALRGLLRRASNGELSDEVLEEIGSMVAPGDMLEDGFSRVQHVHDDVGFDAPSGVGKSFAGLRAIAAGAPVNIPGTNIRTIVNPLGIAPVDELMRNGHVRATLQNWVNQAFDVKDGKPIRNTFWSKSIKRFEYLGFSRREIDELMEALSDPKVVKVEPGFLGKKIAKLKLSNMDPKLRNRIQFALRRDVDRVIQRNKVGNLSPWMQNPMGGVLLQFRKFALNATNKQLAYNLQMMDGKMLATFLGTGALGTLGYMLNTYITAGKYEGIERKKFLEEAFGYQEFMGGNISKLLVAGVVRSGPSGFLPPVLGTVSQFFDPEEQDLFNTYRTSGYTTGLLNLDSNPVGALISGGIYSLRELIPAALNAGFGDSVGNRLTEPELRRILRLLPLRNTIPVNFLMRELIEAADLPEKQR